IKKIQEENGVDVEIDDDGKVYVSGSDYNALQKALEEIKAITAEPEMGKIYKAKVVKIMEFGAFAEFLPGKDGLIHVSEISDKRVNNVGDVLKEGEEVMVKLTKIDSKTGKVSLSIKAAKKEGKI
ncbi:MAG: S1 RNA-binding domain-containing protein, partial [Elusimicrobiota bacterium]|nr:S1 RNA-binding domain-containing protein [Elusimicrobiota bacterium]